ncbi:MAG: hypothetical protein KDA52_25030, partial [Planctomycetaceae bacterium]|nr:hypothetical protein [Planctomycetaceae bacterium]
MSAIYTADRQRGIGAPFAILFVWQVSDDGGDVMRGSQLERMLFSGWDSLVRTLVVGVLAYVALVILLRISGKRTLSKLNAFDLVVTVALGSTLATVLLNRNIALA